MKSILVVAVTFLCSIAGASAQQGGYQQCGGIGWTGATTCIAGWTCTKLNDYYYQCLQGSTTTTTIITTTTTKPPTTTPPTTTTTTTTTSTTTSTGPAASGTQIRAVQDPVFHLYLQNDAGTAVLGPVGTSGYFTFSGSIALNSSSGSKLYLNIGSETTSYRSLSFGTTATTTGWGLEGDTIITVNGSPYGRQLNFLACTTAKSGEYKVYLQLGSATPSGATCSMISLHLPCLC